MQKLGDLAVQCSNHWFATLHFLTPGLVPRDKFVLDITLISMVNCQGGWTGTFNAQPATYHNHSLSQADRVKKYKHKLRYAAIGVGFAILLWCSAVCFLMALACLELSQHAEYRAHPEMDQLTDASARSQFRALCFRQSSARIGQALAKALVKHLLATPSLPIAPPFLRLAFGRK
jgi:hypothetical protein